MQEGYNFQGAKGVGYVFKKRGLRGGKEGRVWGDCSTEGTGKKIFNCPVKSRRYTD